MQATRHGLATGAKGGSSRASNRKPRILFAINSLAGGGAERVFTSLLAASEHRRGDYEFAVALLDEDPQAYELPAWLPVYRLDCGHGLLSSLTRFQRLVSSLRPDLTVSFLTRSNVSAAVAMTLARRPFIISERVNTSAQLAGGFPQFSKAIVRFAYPRAARVIAVSQGVASDLTSDFRVQANRIQVINNPVDADAVQKMAEQEPPFEVRSTDIVAMGRLCPQKNFGLALRAFARSGWNGRLVVMGDGPLAPELQSLAAELRLGDRLVLAGFVDNPYCVIARAALFMLTSNYEGFCNSLLEAMALGVPVLATDCPYSPAEILCVSTPPRAGEVAEGTGGLLVPMGDEDALARAIGKLDTDEKRSAFGAQGRQRVRAFDKARIFEQYWDVIDEVAGRLSSSDERRDARSSARPSAAQDLKRLADGY
jgi:glycosyltransferase involved in cell wall biosynthesis